MIWAVEEMLLHGGASAPPCPPEAGWRGSPPSPEQFLSRFYAAHGSSGDASTHPFLPQAHIILFSVFTLHHQWKTLSHPDAPNLPHLVSEGKRPLIPLHKVSRIQQLQLQHIFFFLFSAGAEFWHFSHSIIPCCFLSSKNNKKGRLRGRSRQIWKRIVSSKVWWELLESVHSPVSPMPKSTAVFGTFYNPQNINTVFVFSFFCLLCKRNSSE